MISGTAEVFGTELAPNTIYTFRNTKASIYTWHGCKIEASGSFEEYIAQETPMTQYVNTHFALENERKKAESSGNSGPVVLIVGPQNSGKTSLAKILTSYATKTRRQPLVVNTDNSTGLLSVPGSLTATVITSILDIEEGFGSSPTNAPSQLPVKQPLCYHYGLPSPEDNSKLYKSVLSRLALSSTSRLKDDPEVRKTGMIIDTSGIISQGKNNYDILSHIITEFNVNVVLTLGSERLYADLTRRFARSDLTVLRLDKSGGCVDRDETYMSLVHQSQIKEYFFGTPKQPLSPSTLSIEFSAITIYQIRQNTAINSAFLPGSDSMETVEQSIYEKVQPNSLMLYSLLAVMYAGVNDSMEAIRDASVMGFVYVAEVDERRNRIKVLSPVGGGIGGRPCVWGSWPEAVGSLLG